jgi:hypothetical protein
VHGLDPSHCPVGLNARRWRELLFDANHLARGWGQQAHALGWTARDLFGAHPEALDARVDMQGLAWTLGGHRILALTADRATIGASQGARMIYKRRGLKRVVLIWELAEQHGDR